MSEIVILVDEQNTPIGAKDRTLIENGDIYRAVGLWITNSCGSILLAQRSLTKAKGPGLWGPAVAGTVESHETYDTCILKEAYEEIGLHVSIKELIRGPMTLETNPGGSRFFGQWYLYSTDMLTDDFVLQTSEVAQVKWFEPDELQKEIAEVPEKFTPSFPESAERFLTPNP